MDQSKKTMRHFYCRDVLWDIFEQMANEFDCSIDYLVNEAMRHYARSKNHGVNPGASAAQLTNQAPPRPAGAAAGPGGGRKPPPPPAAGMGGGPRRPPAAPPPARVPAAEPPPRRGGGEAEPAAGGVLHLIFNNQKIPIDKDQFIIGRGSKTSDLAIKDGNISRKHAAVIRRNGTYYIKDLGSTNGIDFKGMRIDNKRIDEGDIFHLCDYELKFTYRG